MSRKKNTLYNEIKKWKIYIILLPESNNIYIGKTIQKDLRTVFKDHYKLSFSQTTNYIESAKKNNIMPDMFLLEEFENTTNICYSRCIAWGKYFTDKGYFCINGETFRSYGEEMIERTKQFYNEIKEIDINSLIDPEKSLVIGYKPRKTKSDKKDLNYIQLSYTPEEYEIIKKRASKARLNIKTYCKQISLNGQIHGLDFHASDEYLKELREAINTVKRAIVTIYNLKQYFPEDLAKIEELRNVIVKHYKDTVKESIRVHNAVSYRRRKDNK